MKISKELRFEPITIVLETEDELMGLKNIIKYMESSRPSGYPAMRGSYGCSRNYNYSSLSDGGRKMYYSLKAGL